MSTTVNGDINVSGILYGDGSGLTNLPLVGNASFAESSNNANFAEDANTANFASQLLNSRTITLSGDATGSFSFDGSANVNVTVTVVDDSHTHDGRYYTETESDSRFVNVTGDTMSGDLRLGVAGLGTIGGSDWEQGAFHIGDATLGWAFDANEIYNSGAGIIGTLSGDLNLSPAGSLIIGGEGRVFSDGYHPNADTLTTSRTITLDGDVSGSAGFDGSSNITITVTVANDSHTHSFDSLTGKTSGTGDYSTTGDIVSGRGSGGVALTINDGYGNANITWNHQDGTPEQNGNSARIEVNTDDVSAVRMDFELGENVTSGVPVALTNVATFNIGQATFPGDVSASTFTGDGAAITNVNAQTLDGIDGANFLRSNVADTATGIITLTGGLRAYSANSLSQGFIQFGRDSSQFIDIHGEAGGNFITSRSTTTNAKSLVIDSTTDANGTAPSAGINGIDLRIRNSNKLQINDSDAIFTDSVGIGGVAPAKKLHIDSPGFDEHFRMSRDGNNFDLKYSTTPFVMFAFDGVDAARVDAVGTSASDFRTVMTREKADARYVDVAGDTMTSKLTIQHNNTDTLTLNRTNTTSYVGITFTDPSATRWLNYVANNVAGDLFWQSRDSIGTVIGSVLRMDNATREVEIYKTLTLQSTDNDVLNFSGTGVGVHRGISFNNRSGLTADDGDAWLRLNSASEFTSGTYTPGLLRADGGLYFASDKYLSTSTGTYGTVQVNGPGNTGWEGYNIDGRAVFMHDGSVTTGIYNDVDNEWLFRATHNGAAELYYDGSSKIQTNSTGVNISGHLDLNDGNQIRLGTSADFQIWHDGTTTFFRNVLHGGTYSLQGENSGGVNQNLITLQDSNYVRLYSNNSEKFRTHATGVTVFGSLNADANITLNNAANYMATREIRTVGGQQLVLAAGESSGVLNHADMNTEHVYAIGEAGLRVFSSPDNWGGAGWAGRYEATICDNNGHSKFPGTIEVDAPSTEFAGLFYKNQDSADQPAVVLIASDADGTDDLAFEIRGDAVGTSVDLSHTMTSADTTFAVFGNGTTVIGYNNLGTNYTAPNTAIFAVNGTVDIATDLYVNGVTYFGTTNSNPAASNVAGTAINNGNLNVSSSNFAVNINVLTDGTLSRYRSGGTVEGSITVSGTTVSFNGGHLARFAQLPEELDVVQRPLLLKGTVLSNLDEMSEWYDDEGNLEDNEQLNRLKISDVVGDKNVAGVFVNWDLDEDGTMHDMNIGMTGDLIIRIREDVTVQRGDLLMSAGDGTAMPQEDDIIRSKTIAKVTSTHRTFTYEDGSYCVPCVLMAC